MSQQQQQGEEIERDLWDALDRVAEKDSTDDAKLLAWASGVVNWKPKQENQQCQKSGK